MVFVALLAFNKIVITHPFLVAQQEDVIMQCIDNADISIRLRALDLVVGMVSSENLMSIVGTLMRQVRTATAKPREELSRPLAFMGPRADSDDEGVDIKADVGAATDPSLPDEYKVDVINRILQMCSSNNYSTVVDFDWYIDVLIQLVRSAPVPSSTGTSDAECSTRAMVEQVSTKIGEEIRTVAVKVKAVRAQATRAAESILLSMVDGSKSNLTAGTGALGPIVWTIGEYATYLTAPEDALSALLQLSKPTTRADNLATYVQCIPKLLARLTGDDQIPWTPSRKSIVALLLARIIYTLEPLSKHPELEVQDSAAGFLELMKVIAEAVNAQEAAPDGANHTAPLLLTQVLPSLFMGMELNSVAPGAQRNVPLPPGLDLDTPINPNLENILRAAELEALDDSDEDEFDAYYYGRATTPAVSSTNAFEPAINRLGGAAPTEDTETSYQNAEESYLDADIVARRRAQRAERNKDDPFYIAPSQSSPGKSAIHSILKSNNGPDLNIDDIPIMPLDLGNGLAQSSHVPTTASLPQRNPAVRVQIAADENLDSVATSGLANEESLGRWQRGNVPKSKNLLSVDSSHIGSFSLHDDDKMDGHQGQAPENWEHKQQEDEAMKEAMRNVEQKRLEMQRERERVGLEGKEVESAMTVVKKKAKKKKKTPPMTQVEGDITLGDDQAVPTMKPKKKKKSRTVDLRGGEAEGSAQMQVNEEISVE